MDKLKGFMVSSSDVSNKLIPNSIKDKLPVMETSESGLMKIRKGKSSLFEEKKKPIKRKQPTSDEEDDNDYFQSSSTNLIKRPPQLVLPSKRQNFSINSLPKRQPPSLIKPERNPFSAEKRSALNVPRKCPLEGINKLEDPFAFDDQDDFRQPSVNHLIKPTKKKYDAEQEEFYEKAQQLSRKLTAVQQQDNFEADKKKCPYCSEMLFPLHTTIEKALKEIEKKDKEYEESQRIQKANINSSFVQLVTKRQVPVPERDIFCNLHNLELVIKPLGVRKGYPTKINFDDIENRITYFDQELKSVIANKILSDYRNLAEDVYKKQGTTKARSTMSIMNRFESFLPGYYGPKGAATILGVLSKMYLKSGYLQKKLISPQLPLEFLQQVLIPEVGFRLIRQDLVRNSQKGKIMTDMTTKAKTIMVESREYGSAMFPTDEPDIEDVEIDNPIRIVLSDDDDDSDKYY